MLKHVRVRTRTVEKSSCQLPTAQHRASLVRGSRAVRQYVHGKGDAHTCRWPTMRAAHMQVMLDHTIACYRAARGDPPPALSRAPSDADAHAKELLAALAYEAGVEIARVVPAEQAGDAVLPAPVDMDADAPGLLAGREDDGTCHVFRGAGSARATPRQAACAADAADAALARAEARMAKDARARAAEERREGKRAQRQREDAAARAEGPAAVDALRAQRAAARDAAAATRSRAKAKRDAFVAQHPPATRAAPPSDVDDDNDASDAGASTDRETAPASEAPAPPRRPADCEDASAHDLVVHEGNPVTYERLSAALQRADPAPALLARMLGTVPVSADDAWLRLVHGPPGTGKTRYLIDAAVRWVEGGGRALLLGPSNGAAAALYARARDAGIAAPHLAMAPSRVPAGTYAAGRAAERRAAALGDARAVCATVSGRWARRVRDECFDGIFIDEAALLEEAAVWGLAQSCVRRVVLCGDPCQLRAQVSPRGAALRHDVSLMERLMVEARADATFLDAQTRMRADIAALSYPQFYPDRTVACAYAQPDGWPDLDRCAAVRVVDVPEGQQRADGTSWANDAEAAEAARCADALVAALPAGASVVLLAPYAAQVSALRRLTGCDVCTVDAFQGREADGVVLCTVRTDGRAGFWHARARVNVALTRARHALRIVAHVARMSAACDAFARAFQAAGTHQSSDEDNSSSSPELSMPTA